MSIEPKCDFCDAHDKYRCKTLADTAECESFKSYNQTISKRNKPKMDENVKKLTELSVATSRSVIGIIDAMMQRGAVKGEEASAIGMVRDQCVQITQLCETIKSDNADEF